jgi:cytidylate kinase
MAVITISREIGSEGTYIGQEIAQSLGYLFVNKDTIEKVMNQYGLIQFKEIYETAPGFWARFDQMSLNLVKMLNAILLALAQRGNMVILGRGGFAVLVGYADVLNVRIQAPFPVRLKRVMERDQLDDVQEAEAFIIENDKARAAFIQTFYGTRWDNANAYNLVIDTGSVYPELAVSWICQATQALSETMKDGRPATKEIVVDSILAHVVAEL